MKKITIFLLLAIVSTYAQVADLSGLSFCLDPGHGYNSNIGVYGYSEEHKNLRGGLRCRELILAANADTCIMTRYIDATDPSLSQREQIANSAGVTWFHSIHSNAGPAWVNNVLILMEEDASNHRRILSEYSPYFLDQMIAVVTSSTLVIYALYTMSAGVQEKLGTKHLNLTIPFVLYGIFRYLYLVHQRDEGGSPTRMLLTDRPLLIDVLLWALTAGIILYFG